MANWRMAPRPAAEGYRKMECTTLDGRYRDLESKIIDAVYGGELNLRNFSDDGVKNMNPEYG